jgi:hypothetical protein
LASTQVDRLLDPSAPDEERQRRKRRLLKGPKEFRDMRDAVISSSPGELKPVFETMLENATRLCGAEFGVLEVDDRDGSRIAAVYNVPPALAATQHTASAPMI